MGFPVSIHQADRRYPTGATNALAASAQVATAPCWLRAIYGRNGASPEIQIHDAASTPSDGTAPLLSIPVGANQPFSIVFSEELVMANGIFVCNSSTSATKTIGAADVFFVVNWRKKA
jgi:hypothetical protein